MRHKGIPQFFENLSEGIWYYLVVEYIDGKSLQEIKALRGRSLRVREIVDWALQICDILQFIHARSTPIVFRDLKPSHIMLSCTGEIKLIDFGVARLFIAEKDRDTLIQGTFGFAAPEQYGERQTSPQSDIYSFGATLFYLLVMGDINKFAFDFPPVSRLNDEVPRWLEKIIAKCLERKPENRYQDISQIKSLLETMSSE